MEGKVTVKGETIQLLFKLMLQVTYADGKIERTPASTYAPGGGRLGNLFKLL